MVTADEGARYDHDCGPRMMGKPCELRAHQSMIGSQATDWGAVVSASQGSK